MLPLILLAGLWAGAQNALAGGGSFVTLPALIFAGLDPKAANLTSTIALFPGQAITVAAGRGLIRGTPVLGLPALVALSLGGGIAGALLLIATPGATFAALLPWLVLAATGIFAWANYGPKPKEGGRWPRWAAVTAQFASGIYGGYFGGGNGFVNLTLLTLAGLAIRQAGGTKNLLVTCANLSAVVVFVILGGVDYARAAVLGAGSLAGGLIGTWALKRVPERVLKAGVVGIGLALTVGLFLRG